MRASRRNEPRRVVASVLTRPPPRPRARRQAVRRRGTGCGRSARSRSSSRVAVARSAAPLLALVGGQRPQALAALLVEGPGELVAEQHARAPEQGAGHRQPLAHARGVGLDAAVRGVVEARRRSSSSSERSLALGGAHAAQRRPQLEVVPARDPPVEAALLSRDQGGDPRELVRPGGAGPTPATRPVPAVGVSRPAAMRSRLDFPEPLAPARPTRSPALDTDSDTP